MIPVIGLTGFLGAGKTTLLNHLLTAPGARIGVVVNDFGSINVDAGLLTGQVDEAASIAGGCVCCLPEGGGLDRALERLTHPRLRLDAVIVEASGAAEPLALARLIRFTRARRARAGGMIDVIDTTEYARCVERGMLAPARVTAATLIVLNKTDQLPSAEREAVIAAQTAQLREWNPHSPILTAAHGRIDPALVFDVASTEDAEDQLPLAALLRASHEGHHSHACAVTVSASGPADPARVLDLLENPPAGVYRMKGVIPLRGERGSRRHLVNLVGRSIHLATAPATAPQTHDGLVAIGAHFDAPEVERRLRAALEPAGVADPSALQRLERLRRLSG